MKVSFIQRLGFWFYVCDPQPGDLKAAESKEEEKELKMSVNRETKRGITGTVNDCYGISVTLAFIHNDDASACEFQSIISKEAAKLYFLFLIYLFYFF